MSRQKAYTQPTIRIPKAKATELHAAAVAAAAEEKRERQALAAQAIVHAREITSLTIARKEEREALRDAVRIIDALRQNEWTPADGKRLEEIRLLAVLP